MNPIAPDLLAPALCKEVAATLARAGRVHIPSFLTELAAAKLYKATQGLDWWMMFRDGKAALESHLAEFNALEPATRMQVLRRINEQATREFQYLYDKYRISEAIEAGKPCDAVMSEFHAALNSPAVLDYFRALTGEQRIAYVDAQATRYRPGHFLTTHHDEIENVERLYAYVLNLTPKWRPEWGGLLMFVSPDGHIAEAYTPRWNAFNLFKVPQPHTVSAVAPFAPAMGRISITGWMRADKP